MTEKDLTPQESLELINEMISGARSRMKENGFVYLFWGWLILVCALGQFILLKLGYETINYYPYFLVIPGAIYTFIFESRKHGREKNSDYTGKIMIAVWFTGAINMIIAGFVFAPLLQMSPVPIILLLLAMATIVSGAAVKFKALIWGGIICNAAGIASVFLPYEFHPVMVIIGIIAADLVPGYILRKKFKRNYA